MVIPIPARRMSQGPPTTQEATTVGGVTELSCWQLTNQNPIQPAQESNTVLPFETLSAFTDPQNIFQILFNNQRDIGLHNRCVFSFS